MSTPTAIPMADARVSRLRRRPITVLVGIDTANMPPEMAKATKARAPLASNQNSGAAARPEVIDAAPGGGAQEASGGRAGRPR